MTTEMQLNDRLSLGQHGVWKRMAVKWANVRPGNECLDVCCGSGDLAYLLAEAVGKNGKVRPCLQSLRHLQLYMCLVT